MIPAGEGCLEKKMAVSLTGFRLQIAAAPFAAATWMNVRIPATRGACRAGSI
jgi:hypothetical protein